MNEPTGEESGTKGAAAARTADMAFAALVDRLCAEQAELRARLALAGGDGVGGQGEATIRRRGAHQGGP